MFDWDNFEIHEIDNMMNSMIVEEYYDIDNGNCYVDNCYSDDNIDRNSMMNSMVMTRINEKYQQSSSFFFSSKSKSDINEHLTNLSEPVQYLKQTNLSV